MVSLPGGRLSLSESVAGTVLSPITACSSSSLISASCPVPYRPMPYNPLPVVISTRSFIRYTGERIETRRGTQQGNGRESGELEANVERREGAGL